MFEEMTVKDMNYNADETVQHVIHKISKIKPQKNIAIRQSWIVATAVLMGCSYIAREITLLRMAYMQVHPLCSNAETEKDTDV